jgi:hypothetical protein
MLGSLTGKAPLNLREGDASSILAQATMIHKSHKIKVLEMIKKNQPLPEKDEGLDLILLDLVSDGLISMTTGSASVSLTYFGFTELQSWDPILEVIIDNQLLYPYGDA